MRLRGLWKRLPLSRSLRGGSLGSSGVAYSWHSQGGLCLLAGKPGSVQQIASFLLEAEESLALWGLQGCMCVCVCVGGGCVYMWGVCVCGGCVCVGVLERINSQFLSEFEEGFFNFKKDDKNCCFQDKHPTCRFAGVLRRVRRYGAAD